MGTKRTDRAGRAALGVVIVAASVVAVGAIAIVAFSVSANRVVAEDPVAQAAGSPLRAAASKTETKPADAAGNPDAAKPDAAKPDEAHPAAAADQAPPASAAGDHPLDAALAIAHRVEDHINKDITDYTCIFIKQERINGQLTGPQFMQAKFRQKPLSVYLKFIKPEDVKGREVLYVAGANDGKFVVHEASGIKAALGAIWLQPTSALAMMDNKYPITDAGLGHMTRRLIEIAEQDKKYGEVEVHFFKNAKVGKRVCTLIEVVHPTPRHVFLFHKARVYIDDELQVPIHYEAYLWPKEPGQEPPLDESYTYADLKLNVGLTDADFDYKNANYGFVKK